MEKEVIRDLGKSCLQKSVRVNSKIMKELRKVPNTTGYDVLPIAASGKSMHLGNILSLFLTTMQRHSAGGKNSSQGRGRERTCSISCWEVSRTAERAQQVEHMLLLERIWVWLPAMWGVSQLPATSTPGTHMQIHMFSNAASIVHVPYSSYWSRRVQERSQWGDCL